MYHERGIRQVEIAEALHLSQARVSRLLKRAAEVGIVRTIVITDQSVHAELEESLEDRYGLTEAVVVDVEGNDVEIAAGLGSAGAVHLETTMTGGERVGIASWSQTLLAVVDRMTPLRVSGASTIVQLIGGIGAAPVQTEGNRLLTEMAQLLGATATFVPAPGVVGSASIRQSLLDDPAMEDVLHQWAHLSMALMGIGSISPSQLLQASGNAVSSADQEALLAGGAVGDVCDRFFDAQGALVPTTFDERVVGIGPEVLRTIPRRIGIAGGEAKHEAIRAAVVGGWVNVLVTDIVTAQYLMKSSAEAPERSVSR